MELTSDICTSIVNVITDWHLFFAILLPLFLITFGYFNILGAKVAVARMKGLFETVDDPFFDGELLFSVYYSPHSKQIYIYARDPAALVLLAISEDYNSFFIPYEASRLSGALRQACKMHAGI